MFYENVMLLTKKLIPFSMLFFTETLLPYFNDMCIPYCVSEMIEYKTIICKAHLVIETTFQYKTINYTLGTQYN